MLYQLFERRPQGLMEIIGSHRCNEVILEASQRDMWEVDLTQDRYRNLGIGGVMLAAQPKIWTIGELTAMLTICVRNPNVLTGDAHKDVKFLLLVDGLDEYEGNDADYEDLINLLSSFTRLANVKICVSSRPWVIFKEAFNSCPQLRLEDLTHNDLQAFADGRLSSDRHFLRLQGREPGLIDDVKQEILSKAEGVFLWVKLVVEEVLRLARDSFSVRQLRQVLVSLPPDLDDLFIRILGSIRPLYREEASIFMQITLCDLKYEIQAEDSELDRSVSFDGPPFDLLHLFYFGEEPTPTFVTTPEQQIFIFAGSREMDHWIEWLDRLLTSRCMGLLEWHSWSPRDPLCHRRVEFFHRTARDFFKTNTAQQMLFEYSCGPYSALLFRCNTLVADIMSYTKLPKTKTIQNICLYHLTCFLSGIRRLTEVDASIFDLYEKLLDNLILAENERDSASLAGDPMPHVPCWLPETTRYWDWQESSRMNLGLALAIQFGWTAYIRSRLTSQMILDNSGRPLLDYATIPRLDHMVNPKVHIVKHMLSLGAKPNTLYRGETLWVRFIRTLQAIEISDHAVILETIKMLAQSGAHRFIDAWSVVEPPSADFVENEERGEFNRALRAYPTVQLLPLFQPMYDVLDVLEAQSRAKTYESAFSLTPTDRIELDACWPSSAER